MTATPLQEERANTLTHAFGLLLGIVAVPALLVNQYGAVPAREWLSMLVFGFTLLQVYATSTIYHAVTGARWKYRLRVLDHISIYFLIAGTHTPLLVHYLPGESGRFYLIVIWAMAFSGLIYKLFFFGRWEWLSVAFYLVMG
ncbi:hemolysin III family protein, partial [Phaeodactylibacter sp.]